jgi:flagellar biosynthesis GTPase FlhF
MELKRILARDSRSANEKAIQLYGPEVLIISTQRVDQQTELIVAVDVCAAPLNEVADAVSLRKTSSESGVQPKTLEFTSFSQVFQQANGGQLMSASPQNEVETSKVDEVHVDSAIQPLSPPVDMAKPAPQAAEAAVVAYEQQRNHEIVDLLRQEMAALRKEFALSRQMQVWQPVSGQHPEIQKLSVAMAEAGIPTGMRALLTDGVSQLESLEEAWPVMGATLMGALQPKSIAVPDKGVHVLCGPTGSGKTSMLGRLAYAAAQAHGAEQQVMISFADQRPGAWSQIQLLAAQAGARCFRAADLSVLRTLLEEFQGHTVWIDTPGIDFIAMALQLLQQKQGIALHAVLPVDATVTNVQKIFQNSPIPWSSLMLTKMDEAAHPWPLIQGLCDTKLPVSAVSEGHQTNSAPVPLDHHRLLTLALSPVYGMLPLDGCATLPVPPVKPARKPRTSKLASSEAVQPIKVRARSRAVKAEITTTAA